LWINEGEKEHRRSEQRIISPELQDVEGGNETLLGFNKINGGQL
jgi:hypothetical protein